MPSRPSIFVAIAAYRDRETAPTIQDLFRRAAHPERVTVGICWQAVPGEDDPIFPSSPRPEQTRYAVFDARESRGAGWARNVAHGLREGEQYALQLDSHMRFHDGWDETLLEELAACGSDRPVLSTYPAAYEPPGSLNCGVFMLTAAGFDRDGILTFAGRPIWSPVPVPCAYLAGGLIFAKADFFDHVPYDPLVYFIGEEVGLAARGWTRGYDFFAPTRCIIHHYYGRSSAPKHWSDHRDWGATNAVSQQRVRHLLGTLAARTEGDLDALGGPLGVGDERSLEDYQRFAGVDFARKAMRPGRVL